MESSAGACSTDVVVLQGVDDKVFNDPVHGPIRIPALCIAIIDTPQFQRLRRIQQLGGVSYVYYGATHTRFEHSIGVCYLAGKLLEHLQKEQPELGIDKKDILCVQVAGLCHDLGHGPFSHLWDKRILKELGHSNLKHEDLSEKMLDRLVDQNDLRKVFEQHFRLLESECNVDDELTFIKDLIRGRKSKSGTDQSIKGEEEKEKEKRREFLYEIISNEKNKIDVDKWDYFARDCYYLGVKNSFDHLRLMNFARVIHVKDKETDSYQICYRDKEVSHVYGMFYTRNLLHQKAYQHKTVKAIECMLADAIISAKDLLKFLGENGEMKTLRETADDMVAYETLDDTVISHIRRLDLMECPDELKDKLKKTQRLINNFDKRNIYRCFTSKPIDTTKQQNEKDILKFLGEKPKLLEEDFSFESVIYDYGMKKENPVDKVYFYGKCAPDEAKPIPKNEVSMMLPETFREVRLLMIFKNLELKDKNEINDIKKQFEKFCEPFTLQSATDLPPPLLLI